MSTDFSVGINDLESSSSIAQSSNMSDFDSDYSFKYVFTECGYMYVAFSKDLKNKPLCKPVLVTFHDVGFNYRTSFEYFFQNFKMHSILNNFYVVHLNAPGQELFAKPIELDMVSRYPSMDRIACSIGQVVQHFGISEFVAFGVGAGANILARFELMKPKVVTGLFLVNVAYDKTPFFYSLKGQAISQILQNDSKMSQLVRKFALARYFGNSAAFLPMLVKFYQSKPCYRPHYMHPGFNSYNFALFLDAFHKRTKLNLQRHTENNISCTVLLITSEHSSSVEDTMQMAAQLNPHNSSFLKMPSSTDAMRDKHMAVANAFQLFLQGLGYIRFVRLVGLEDDDEMSSDK